jgi:hypothetical protein
MLAARRPGCRYRYATMPENQPLPQNPGDKPWWQSRTIIWALVIIAAQIAGRFGLEIDSAALTDTIIAALSLLGGAGVLYGRIKATRPIRFHKKKPVDAGDSADIDQSSIMRTSARSHTRELPAGGGGAGPSGGPDRSRDPRGAFSDNF